jgi:hypothetical protein
MWEVINRLSHVTEFSPGRRPGKTLRLDPALTGRAATRHVTSHMGPASVNEPALGYDLPALSYLILSRRPGAWDLEIFRLGLWETT